MINIEEKMMNREEEAKIMECKHDLVEVKLSKELTSNGRKGQLFYCLKCKKYFSINTNEHIKIKVVK